MIAIYGSNGFIGRHLVRRLAERGLPARAVSRRHDPDFVREVDGSVEFVEADLFDPLAMTASLGEVDTVVQLISTSSPGMRNDHTVVDIQENVIPHVQFLRDCVQAGVRRFVFLSSGGTVYGPGSEVPTPETAPTRPISSHGLTKLMVEKYIEMHALTEGLEYVILRLANPYGPGQEFRKGQGLIPAVLDHHRRGLPVRVFGQGLAQRDYVYIDDVVDAITSAITHEELTATTLNVGSGQPRSVLEVLHALEAALGTGIRHEFVDARSTDVDVSWLDISRARDLIGWKPETPFDEGIRRTVASI